MKIYQFALVLLTLVSVCLMWLGLNPNSEARRDPLFCSISFFWTENETEQEHRTRIKKFISSKLITAKVSVSQLVGRDPLWVAKNIFRALYRYVSPNCILFCFVGRQQQNVENHWPRAYDKKGAYQEWHQSEEKGGYETLNLENEALKILFWSANKKSAFSLQRTNTAFNFLT